MNRASANLVSLAIVIATPFSVGFILNIASPSWGPERPKKLPTRAHCCPSGLNQPGNHIGEGSRRTGYERGLGEIYARNLPSMDFENISLPGAQHTRGD